jgi:carboxyl-terminal processing protease
LYLLVNGQTASAAEILTAALNTHLKAPIFWSPTYGKWSVQQLFPLSDGGELKVTIAHWRTPNNQLLDGVGITPTHVILPTAQDIISGTDAQLDKTISQIYEIQTQK